MSFETIQPELTFHQPLSSTHFSVGTPPDSPLLGINNWIPDSLENLWYGRAYGGGQLWFEYLDHGVYLAYDANGNWVATYVETTQDRATRTLGGHLDIGADSTNGGDTGTVYLRPAT
jgi:hypothetical protein